MAGGPVDVRAMGWYPVYRHTVFSQIGGKLFEGATSVFMIGIKPSQKNACTAGEYPALQQDLHSAFEQKKAPFFNKEGKQVCEFERIMWKQVGVDHLEEELEVSSKKGKCALVCSCSEDVMEKVKEIMTAHNKKDGFSKVTPCWASAQDMYRGGAALDPANATKHPSKEAPAPRKEQEQQVAVQSVEKVDKDKASAATEALPLAGAEYQVGEHVQHWSETKNRWMKAIVEDVREEDGRMVYDLNRKKRVAPDKLRRPDEEQPVAVQSVEKVDKDKDTIEFTITRGHGGTAGFKVGWNPLRVKSVELDGPARWAGMREGHVDWIVTHVDDLKVTAENGGAALAATQGPYRTFTIRVKRPAKEQPVAVQSVEKVDKDKASAATEERRAFVFVGNPGAGKSTLANCKAGKVLFQAGMAVGQGMTYKLFQEEMNGQLYIDTPGLADVKLRKAAAEAISQALKKGGPHSIIFVVREESGRVSPQDKATMKVVLEACPELGSDFAVVVNKCGKGSMKIFKDEGRFEQFKEFLFKNLPSATSAVTFAKRVEDLDDEEDAIVELDGYIDKFLDNAPVVNLTANEASDVNASTYDDVVQNMEALAAELQAEREAAKANQAKADAALQEAEERRAAEAARAAEAQRKQKEAEERRAAEAAEAQRKQKEAEERRAAEAARAAEDQRKLQAELQRKEEEKRIMQEEQRRREEEQRQAELQRKEEEKRRIQQEQRRREEEQRQAELQRKEEEKRRMQEEQRRREEEQRKARAEAEQKQAEAVAKAIADTEAKAKAELQRKEEEKRRMQEEQRRREEEQRQEQKANRKLTRNFNNGVKYEQNGKEVKISAGSESTDSDLIACITEEVPTGIDKLTFDCYYGRKFTDTLFQELAKNIPSGLTKLALAFEENKNFTDAAIRELAKNIPSGLTKLDLRFTANENFTDAAIRELAKNIPSNLETLYLDFRSNQRFTDAAIRDLSKALPTTLTSLSFDFYENKNFTDTAVQELIGAIPVGCRERTLYFKGKEW